MIKMKHILLCTALMVLCMQSYSQVTFFKSFKYGVPKSNCQGWGIKEDSDGNFILLFRYSGNLSFGIDFGFIKLNQYGDSLSNTVFNLQGDNFVDGFILDEKNIIHAMGSRALTGGQSNERIYYQINLADPSKNTFHVYNNPEGFFSTSSILKKHNSIYLTGEKQSSKTLTDFNIQKIDPLGTTQFDSSLKTRLADAPYNSIFSNDGNIVMTGLSYTGSTFDARVLTMKSDTFGNEIWRSFVGIEWDSLFRCRSRGNGVIQSSNGNYYIAGGTNNWCDTNLSARGRNQSLLICLDSNGNHLWTKKELFADYHNQYYQNIYLTKDGILCTGQVGLSSPLGINYNLLLAKYDFEGNLLWFHTVGEEETLELVYATSLTKNGDILVTGRYQWINAPANESTAFVMKLDACGCYVPNCNPNCTASGITESRKQYPIKVYPNPATNMLTIESNQNIDRYIIYNLLGEKQLEGIYNNSIDISILTQGMYLMQIESEGVFSTIKFIKE